VDLPAHYAIEGMCAACRGAIKSGDERYRIGDRDYHAHCFDISLVGPWSSPPLLQPPR
jgi:hypothetical protein